MTQTEIGLKPSPINPLMLYKTAVAEGHRAAVKRDNASSNFLLGSFSMNGQDALKSVCCALGTMGGIHAPVTNCYQLLSSKDTALIATKLLGVNMKIPGFGNSFVRGEFDPIWGDADNALEDAAPELHAKIRDALDVLIKAGKPVFPNAAIYTAACAILMKIPAKIAPMLVLEFRAAAWREHLQEAYYPDAAKENKPTLNGVDRN